MNWLPSSLVYFGILVALTGAISAASPLHFLGIHSRSRASVVLGAGFLLAIAGMLLPAPLRRVQVPRTELDGFVPAYQFGEFHQMRIHAPRERVYRALSEVTAGEITLFRTLTWIRRLGQPGPESILNAPEDVPLLEVATRTSFLKLAEIPGQEIVVGTLVVAPSGFTATQRSAEAFRALDRPGFAKAAMNFRLEDAEPGVSLLTTETRVYATDDDTRRRFAAYWRVIYPGSALIRVVWLRAIRRRAEAAHP